MAYNHMQYQVPMNAAQVTTFSCTAQNKCGSAQQFSLTVTANGANYGMACYHPVFFPIKIVAAAVKTDQAGTNPINYIFSRRIAAGTPSTEFIFPVPTTAATGLAVYRFVTHNCIINPGETIQCAVSTAVDASTAAAWLLIEPVWEQPGNCTGMVAATA